MLWILIGIVAALISAFYYKVVLNGDKVEVAAVKKKSSEGKSQRSQRKVKSPQAKSPSLKSPQINSPQLKSPSLRSPVVPAPDVNTCDSPTKSERVQSQVKVDKPTTPAPIDDQSSEGPTKDVLTAKEPSQVLDLTPEIQSAPVQNQTAVEPTQTEVIQGHINPDAPTLPAPIDTQSGEGPSKDVSTAVDPTPSDVKQSRISNDLTPSDVQSAEASPNDPAASEVKQAPEVQGSKPPNDQDLVPMDSQMSALSEVNQPAKEAPSEAKDSSQQASQQANEPEIKKDQPSAATEDKEKEKKKKKKKDKKHKRSKKEGEEGGEKKDKKKKRKHSKKKSKADGKSKEEGKSKDEAVETGAGVVKN